MELLVEVLLLLERCRLQSSMQHMILPFQYIFFLDEYTQILNITLQLAQGLIELVRVPNKLVKVKLVSQLAPVSRLVDSDDLALWQEVMGLDSGVLLG